MRRLLTATLLLSCLTGCGASAPNNQIVSTSSGATTSASATPAVTPEVNAQLDAAILAAMKQDSIPGVIVSVRSPNFTYEKSFGVANKATGAPMQSDMVLRIGSVTKTFTVTAILQLVDQGLIGLDDPISKYVSGVPSGDQITLRQMAGMQSGLYNYTNDEATFQAALAADPLHSWSTQELLNIAFSHPNNFAPGTNFEYCNTNTVLLGVVIEKVTGKALPAALQQLITQPLALSRTALATDNLLPDPHAHGYTEQFQPGVQVDATDWNPTWAGAAGAMYSAMEDLHIWASVLGTGTLLSPATQAARLQTVPFKDGPPGSTYGLGIIDMSGWLGHGGNLPGYGSIVGYLPSGQATLVVLVNHNPSSNPVLSPNLLIAHAVTAIITPGNIITVARDPE